jgi:nucleoside-diphosphate-sugar epimerase
MNVLVTGSGTLLGNSVCQFLANKKINVVATYRKHFPKNLKKKRFIKLKKLDLTKNFEIDEQIDALVHCASAIPDYKLSNKLMMKTNYIGFKRLLLKLSNTNCKKIILISTLSIYGNISCKTLTEKYKGKQLCHYGKTKLLMEDYLSRFSKSRSVISIIFRLPGIIGYRSEHNFLSGVLSKIKLNKKIKISHPNFKFNNLIHAKNLAQIIHEALLKENRNKIYNLANKHPMKLSNIINYLFFKFKKKKNYEIVKTNTKPFNIKLSKNLLKNYHIFSVRKSLDIFLNENKL